MNKRKKAIILLYTYLILWFIPKKNKNNITYNDNYNSLYNQEFATYDDNLIYIIPITHANEIPNNNENNIYVIDYRNSNNPVIAINNSYQIISIKEIKAIIEVLQEYENKYPSNWDRTTKSMFNEWLIHNICYYLNIERNRTKEVDFDNDEEIIYSNYLNIFEEIKSIYTDAKTKKLNSPIN